MDMLRNQFSNFEGMACDIISVEKIKKAKGGGAGVSPIRPETIRAIELDFLSEKELYHNYTGIYGSDDLENGIQLEWGKYGYSVAESEKETDRSRLYSGATKFNERNIGKLYAKVDHGDKYNTVKIKDYDMLVNDEGEVSTMPLKYFNVLKKAHPKHKYVLSRLAKEAKKAKAIKDAEVIAQKLNLSKERATDIVRKLSDFVLYDHIKKDHRIWPTRNFLKKDFNDLQEALDYLKSSFATDVYDFVYANTSNGYNSETISEGVVILFGQTMFEIKFNRNGFIFKPNGDTDWSKRGETLEMRPYFQINTANYSKQEIIAMFQKGVDDFLWSFNYLVVPTLKEQKNGGPINNGAVDERATLLDYIASLKAALEFTDKDEATALNAQIAELNSVLEFLPAETPPAETPSLANWKTLFANPEKFLPYGGQFLYPPRIKSRFPPSSVTRLDTNEYIGQPKLNGSNTSVAISAEKEIAKERHNTFFAVPPKFDFKSMHRGEGWMSFAGEYMNKSKKDANGNPFKGFCIWDIMAFENEILIGSTPQERINLIDMLYPSREPAVVIDGIVILYATDFPGIYKVNNFYTNFTEIYQKIIQVDMVEGFVMKRKNGKLEHMTREDNNVGWSVKVRKPTANYRFRSGGAAIRSRFNVGTLVSMMKGEHQGQKGYIEEIDTVYKIKLRDKTIEAKEGDFYNYEI
jgi:hypothetical protein